MSAAEFDDTAIAVIGMACRFPGAANIDAFWDVLAEGRDTITRFTDEELRAAGVPAEQLAQDTYVRAKGLLPDATCFDAEFFGIPRSDAALMDPQQRVFIECAHSALEHAGYSRTKQQVGVFGGSILSMYLLSNIWPNTALRQQAGTFSIAVGNDPTFLATRTSYLLDLKGPSVSVGTACSTGLVAVHQACQSLLSMECDMALAGGVSIHLPLISGYAYTPGSILSPDGVCRPFDKDAAGTVSSDGCGVVTLKRLSDALEDQDVIHAVIRGSALNNDGRDKVGFTAPSVTPQAQVIAEAQAIADAPPESITMIEAHAAGTAVGDPIELAALSEVFGAVQTPCALGSVKSNIGHVDAASGIAGFLKATLALSRRAIPPSVHFKAPNAALARGDTPFYVPTELTPHDPAQGPMRAGVSSFGIGGTNCHVVLQEPPTQSRQAHPEAPHILRLSAKTGEALGQAARDLADHLSRAPVALCDVAHTLWYGRELYPRRLAIAAQTPEQAAQKLRAAADQAPSETTASGVVFMFPGLGDHYPLLGWELYCSAPAFRAEIDACTALLQGHLDQDIRDILYPEKDWARAAPEQVQGQAPAKLDLRAMLKRDTPAAPQPMDFPIGGQTGIFVTEYALARLLQAWGLSPSALVGYSIGEFVAACLAGIVSVEDALRIVALRAKLIESHVPRGGMMAVPLGEDALAARLPQALSIGAASGGKMTILSGPVAALEDFATALKAEDISVQMLGATYAYHSKMMSAIEAPLAEVIGSARLNPPRVPVVSCVTGKWLTDAEAMDPHYWARHLSRTVRFRDAVSTLMTEGNLALAELGPGQSLTAHSVAVRSAAQSNNTIAPLMKWSYSSEPEREALLAGLARLWSAGLSLDGLPEAQGARKVPLPTYPFARTPHWIEPVTATTSQTGRRPSADWALAPSWAPAPMRRRVTDKAQRFFLLGQGRALTEPLADALRAAGEEVQFFSELTALASTLKDGSLDGALPHIVLLDLIDAAADFEAAQRVGYDATVSLFQTIAAIRSEEIRLTVLATGLSDPLVGRHLQPDKATVLGALLVAAQERPGLTTLAIDLEPDTGPEQAVRQITESLYAEVSAPLIAYRNGRRFRQIYSDLALPETHMGVLRPNGVYVITGGLGGVGLAVAAYLSGQGPLKLALLGRSASDAALDPAKRAALEGIRAQGSTVELIAADVADEAAMRGAFETITEKLGPINGVIHCAGAIGAETFSELKGAAPADAQKQFRAKIVGTRVLDNLLSETSADFCVLMSSLAAQLGGLGFSAYAAANLWMDAFAESKLGAPGPRWVSLNWDAWQIGNIRAAVDGFGATVSDYFMEPEIACDLMLRALAQTDLARVVVSTGDLQQRLSQWVQGRPDPAITRQKRAATPKDFRAPTTPIEKELAQIWQDLFAIEPIGLTDNFFALGGHSLLATQLNARITSRTGAELSLAAVLRAPTIAELAALVESALLEAVDESTLEDLVSEIDGLSDAALDALLSEQDG